MKYTGIHIKKTLKACLFKNVVYLLHQFILSWVKTGAVDSKAEIQLFGVTGLHKISKECEEQQHLT